MRRKKILTIAVLVVIVIVTFSFTACSLKKSDPFLLDVEKRGKLIVGTFSEFKPFTFKNENGDHAGYDIDLIKKVAEKLDFDIEFREIFFLDLFPAIDSREIDIAISGITITSERARKYLFSDPYINVGQVVVALKNNKEINSADDVRNKKIGTTKGTTLEESAKKITSEELVFAYDDLKEVEALRSGEVDALVRDYVEALILIDNNPEFKIAGQPFIQDYYGIMVHKENEALMSKINKVLGEMSRNNSLKQLRLQWLGE